MTSFRKTCMCAAIVASMCVIVWAEADGITTPTAVAQVLARSSAVRTIWIRYSQQPVRARSKASRYEFMGKADAATSTGWTLSIERQNTGETLSAILTEYLAGTAYPHNLRPSGGTWQEGPNAVKMIPEQQPVDECMSFLHHSFLPGGPAGAQVVHRVLVNGRTTDLPFVSVHDADGSATLCATEPGLLSFEGESSMLAYAQTEFTEEFLRDPVLGLVPRQKTVRSKREGLSGDAIRYQLHDLRVNDPGLRFGGDEDSTATIMKRYHP